MRVTMQNFAGIKSTTRWIVLYSGPQDDDEFNFWAAVQIEAEANYEAYRREKLGWRTRIIPPTPEVYDPLPTYAECCERVAQGTASAVHWFIYDYEPIWSGQEEFRRRLATAVRQSGGRVPRCPSELDYD
jgi:hypothetical protein